MITALHIKSEQADTFPEKIKSFFVPYRIDTDIMRYENISLFNITYHRYRGAVRFDKIYEKCIGFNKVVLCDKNVNLFNTPFRRFESFSLQRCLMRNYLVSILSQADIYPKNLKIAYFDPEAEYPSMLCGLLNYTSDITVVTDMPAFYENEAERITADTGAVIRVSTEIYDICCGDIIVAPDVIRKKIPTAESSIIFTVDRPAVSLSGNIICRYTADYPEELVSICPENTELWYFMSALYSVCRQKQLGDIVPSSCGDIYRAFANDLIIRNIKAKCMFDLSG